MLKAYQSISLRAIDLDHPVALRREVMGLFESAGLFAGDLKSLSSCLYCSFGPFN